MSDSALSAGVLRHAPSDLIGGTWRPIAGDALRSTSPADNSRLVWSGRPVLGHVDEAVAAARKAAPAWAALPFEKRAAVLRTFAKIAASRTDALASLICDEVGKPMWDAKAEAGLLASKVDITLDSSDVGSLRRVTGFELNLGGAKSGACWFRPHGVMAVVGPFNFPAHLPNGHIVPALAMGNTIVMKPSDKTPAIGQFLIELFHEAAEAENAPAGVVNLVQGGGDVASRLVSHEDIDGVLFTGSWAVGRRIMEANLDRPGRVLALEMGGNNPAIVMPDANLKQAVIEIVRCAFITSGQRCTCTRRVIVHRSVADRVIPAILKATSSLIIGEPRASHPVFMGPVISTGARASMLETQNRLARAGGEVLIPMQAIDGPSAPGAPAGAAAYITPGVMRVDRFFANDDAAAAGADVEVFGPFLRICVVDSLDEAIAQANATRFGLASSIFTADTAAIERFRRESNAGCVNVNTGTAGASSKLPFGGLGLSGNHRPAGAFSLDYCAIPIAGMTEGSDASTLATGMRFEESWL